MNTNRYPKIIFPFVILLINALLLFALILVIQPGLAAPQTVITVDSTADVDGGSDCTLRNAIKAAQKNSAYGGCPAGSSSGTDVIVLAAGATYTLSIVDNNTNGANAFTSTTSAIAINGNGATIRRDESVSNLRLFYVRSGGALTLNNLLIRNFNINSIGAAIYATYGPLTVTNCTFFQNTATGSGGAIRLYSNLTKISESSFFDNYSDYSGGAIINDSTTFITNTTFYSNSAKNWGGGISVASGWVTLTNATFSANESGFQDYGHSLSLAGESVTPTISYRNSIITWNSIGANCAIVYSKKGIFINGGGNLVYPSADLWCDGTVADPKLGTYQDNGGPTYTFALLTDSPAIDTAQDSICPTTDQRGVSRPIDGDKDGVAQCDIGAYERQLKLYFPIIMR